MNEYQRQTYLSALGLEDYAPRWLLPGAPVSMACELPELPETDVYQEAEYQPEPASEAVPQINPVANAETADKRASSIEELMRDMVEPTANSKSQSAKVASAPTTSESAAPIIKPFTLSIWRSALPVLILDARQPKSAMPTERLLRDLLASLGLQESSSLAEEVLSWPLVENASVKLTAEDARAELHTWLEAELERRPVRQLVFMGSGAARYFLSQETADEAQLWQSLELSGFEPLALLVPSLIELLQQPLLKRDLWLALQGLQLDH